MPGSFSTPGVATPGLHVLKMCPSINQLVTVYIVSRKLGALESMALDFYLVDLDLVSSQIFSPILGIEDEPDKYKD